MPLSFSTVWLPVSLRLHHVRHRFQILATVYSKRMKLLLLVAQTALFFSSSLSEAPNNSNSPFFSWIKELQKELFNVRQYNKHARPISNDSEQVIKVDMQFSFVRAVLNEKDSTLETDGWLGMRWVDSMMKWDPTAYGDLRNLKLMSDLLWKPDIVVFNSVRGYDPMPPSQSVLLYDGVVYYIPRLYLITPCDLDLTKWPNGFQKCEIRFGAWTLDSSEIFLGVLENQTKADLKHYKAGNLQWKITDTTITTNSYFNCCSPHYQDVIVTIQLHRQSSMAEKVAIISSVGLWILVLLTYWMRPQSTDRMTIAYSCSFGMIFIFIYFLWKLPTGKNIPIVVITHSTLLLLCGLNYVITMINRKIAERSCKSVPRWINFFTRNRVFGFLLRTRVSPDNVLHQVCFEVDENPNTPSSFSPLNLVDQPVPLQGWNQCNSAAHSWQLLASISDRFAFFICMMISFPIIGYTGFVSIMNN
ncbi:neuronal acetylcholine receptor subunit alpha-2-like isoform X1 [Daphnia pulicaria]|uniref:neuronal acetylcholine receptor subunit alpha-2-like isoform X1 n=1 Tax=Daphnia pulicaria TaxID=35523 RepID=UPI001EECA7F4|nr:neuronal acetylcholine receptor subunit alpha-2-like isoform X1 [Daphnia pulicaria]